MISASVFSAWAGFYVIMGSAAATLTGLMFVAVTLISSLRGPDLDEGTSAFGTPTVVHFCTALLVSAVMCAPWDSVTYVAWILAVVGLSGLGYMLLIISLTRKLRAYIPDLEDWIWFNVLPCVAYIAITLAGALLTTLRDSMLFVLAGAALLLVFIGIRNAWDSVRYVAIVRPRNR